MKNILKTILAIAVLAIGVSSASAITLTFGDSRSIGLINDGIPSSPTDGATYINNLMTVTPGTGGVIIGTESYTRTSNVFGALPAALGTVGNFLKQDNGTPVFDLGAGGYTYLLAKYDAENAGTYVWNVTGLTGPTAIPANFIGDKWGLSHSVAYGPGGTQNVPDGGITIAMLGGAFFGLIGLGRRFGFLAG